MMNCRLNVESRQLFFRVQYLNIRHLVSAPFKRLAAGESVLGISIPDSQRTIDTLVFLKPKSALILKQSLVFVQPFELVYPAAAEVKLVSG